MPATRRRSPVKRTKATSSSTLYVASSPGNTNIGKAAEIIAKGIKSRAAEFSRKIPPTVHVGQGSATHATVYASAPNAYPIETGARHPLFGMTGRHDANDRSGKDGDGHWYPMRKILFMEEGAARVLDKAAEAYGYPEIDDWLRQVDW